MKAWVPALLVLAALVALAIVWIVVTDPFCWHGYLTPDGSCAWE